MQEVSAANHELSGRIERAPLLRAIFQLHKGKSNGMLLLRHIELSKKIYFEEGEIVYVISNSTLESIGQFLMRKNILTPLDLQQGLQNQKKEGGSLISSLIRMGKITREQAMDLLSEQAIFRIIESATWQSGRYYFYPKELAPASRMPFKFTLFDVLLEGLRNGFNIERLRGIFAPYKDARFHISQEIVKAAENLKFEADEKKAAGLFPESEFTVFDYLKKCADSGVVPLVSLRILYLFVQMEYVSFAGQPAIPANPIAAQVAHAPPTPVVLMGRDDLTSAEATVPDYIATTQPIDHADMPTIQEGASPELVEFAQQLQNLNYFERLDVNVGSTDDEVKSVYLELMKQYHPDLYPIDSPDRTVCEQIVGMLTQAYQFLKTAEARKECFATLQVGGNEEGVDISNVIEAEKDFMIGKQLLKNNNPVKALEHFNHSKELLPKEKSFSAYATWSAYLTTPTDSGLLERALDEMIRLNENSQKPDAYAYLACGRIYKQKGDLEKAETAFKQCLSVEKKNLDAARELRLIEMRRGKTADKKSEKSETNSKK